MVRSTETPALHDRLERDEVSQAVAPQNRSLPAFFVLVFVLSVPFWLVGAVSSRQLLPDLPVSSLMAVCPLIAASLLVYREHGIASVIALLKRSFDYQRIRAKIWYVPIVLLMPGVMILTYGLMRVLGMSSPSPRFPLPAAFVLVMAFFLAAQGEEVGWSGYAIDPMQERWGALHAGVLLGVWAVWHLVPLLQAQRAPAWIAGWCLSTVALRVLIVWLYNTTGKSVFAAILVHGSINVSTLILFPQYDPGITGLLLAGVAAIVTVIWGPRTLARYRNP